MASVLFPEYRRRVLGLLLLRPEEALHGREIARRVGLPAGTVTRELTKLALVGLPKREKRGNQQVYSAQTQAPVFAELASILRKTSRPRASSTCCRRRAAPAPSRARIPRTQSMSQ
jgi:hypothetical protein